MNLSATGSVVLVVVIAAAVIAMVAVIAGGNRRAAKLHSDPRRDENPAARYPGLDPRAADQHAQAAGDDTEATVLPGGHVVRNQSR